MKRNARGSTAMNPPPGGVSIRMYSQGLGDCFLLAFHREGDTPWFMLIDCGVIIGTRKSAAAMNAVGSNIYDTTGGHIDLLVITHEHWDHISGFIEAKTVFDRFKSSFALG